MLHNSLSWDINTVIALIYFCCLCRRSNFLTFGICFSQRLFITRFYFFFHVSVTCCGITWHVVILSCVLYKTESAPPRPPSIKSSRFQADKLQNCLQICKCKLVLNSQLGQIFIGFLIYDVVLPWHCLTGFHGAAREDL